MIIDGKNLAHILEQELIQELQKYPPRKVAFVLFEDNLASEKFVEMKVRVAKRLGVVADVYKKDINTTEEAKDFLNTTIPQYDGIVLQLPIPAYLDGELLIEMIPKEKDIDVLTKGAMENFKTKKDSYFPPVARAVYHVLKSNDVVLENKHMVIVGNGALVGAPVAALFDRERISYIQIDKDTPVEYRFQVIKDADIIISGVGFPSLIKPDMIKDGVVLIDAGTSEQSGILVGDIDKSCADKATLYTPVPGGIGPITVVSLFYNLVY